MEICYVAQWLNGAGTWKESIGVHMQGDDQQADYARKAGIAEPRGEAAAREFARVLAKAGFTVRIIKRTDEVVEI